MVIREASRDNYESLILAYAAGILDQAHSMIIAAHLALSPEARKLVQTCEAIGGTLLEEHCEPVPMRKTSLGDVLGQLEECRAHKESQKQKAKSVAFPEDVNMPECVMHTFSCSPCKTHWKTVYPGLKIFDLQLSCKSSGAKLMKAEPAFHSPQHAHSGTEITLVLDGAFRDESGFYKRGDLVVAGEDYKHSMAACKDQGCIAMVVTTGSMRLTGLASLLNPFLRF